ncbi:outer membrane protein A [Pannonibacter phragmitetus]|uniref:Outer membrane protein A n=1 Tax=Pannonibacter phragmitetus TaxID=121719 RepID=A0A378ZUI1_9HYPH|nr:OmpA family protein [Pannonibacter phragmitetus]SUB00191.1 outer membrane protein A [Pannonibacter phragmitetus]
MISTRYSLARLAAISIAGVSLIVFPANAGSINVTFTLAGEAFDGPPAYEIRYGDQEIAKGTVENAIDTSTDGQLSKLKNWQDHQKEVTVTVDSADLEKNLPFSVHFTNDKWGGAGTAMDRNLYVLSAEVGCVKVPPQDIKVTDKALPQEDTTGPTRPKLSNNSSFAVIEPPSSGWLSASAKTADNTSTEGETPPVSEAPAQEAQTQAGPDPADKVPEAQAEATPAPSASPAAPQAPGPEATVPAAGEKVPNAPKSKASTNTATPSPKAKCAPKRLNVTGFPLNRSDLPAEARLPLKTLAELSAKEGSKLEVTGFSSMAGPRKMNEALADARARAVADFLKEQGASADSITIVTGGETRRFGRTGALNRRVTVEVMDGN